MPPAARSPTSPSRSGSAKRSWTGSRPRASSPIPVGYPRTTTIAELREKFPGLESDTATGERVSVAGRILLSRTGGKLCFATIREGEAEVQVMASLDKLGEQSLADWKADLDLGDHVGVPAR